MRLKETERDLCVCMGVCERVGACVNVFVNISEGERKREIERTACEKVIKREYRVWGVCACENERENESTHASERGN